MDNEHEKMLKRVQRLLAKAEDTEFPEEAETCTVMAAELMSKYGIDRAMASARADKREKPVSKVFSFPQPYAKQHCTMFFNILVIFGGDGVLLRSPSRHSKAQNKDLRFQVYAFEADLMAVEVLYTSLLLQATHRLNNADVPDGEHLRSFKTGWWIGFLNEIVNRLKEARATAEDSVKEPGTAIVLRDRSLEVRDAMLAEHGAVRRGAASHTSSAAGFETGMRDGQRANLHNQANVGQRQRTAIG